MKRASRTVALTTAPRTTAFLTTALLAALLPALTGAQEPRRLVEAPEGPPIEALIEAPPEELTFSTLASYTFDREPGDTSVASGPDTFRVFESSRGRVTRTTHFRLSGEHSLELRDVAHNHDFPELLGTFDRRTSGQLYAHFAFLVVDPEQELNIAFVGPRWFRMEKDGFAFWLQSRDGVLRHISDSIPKKLFEVRPFTWYLVDVLYDVDRGTYQLLIEEEGAVEPLVSLADQPNVTSQPGSAVDKFSFVSDPFEDLSEVVYYVDDIVLGADEVIPQERFVAPGRRQLFVRMEVGGLDRQRRQRLEQDGQGAELEPDPWLDAMVAGSFGLAYREAQGQLGRLEGAAERAVWVERAGDAALLEGDPALALQLYDEALAPSGYGPSQIQLLKRADAHHLLGDAAAEKRLREAIYGTLDPVDEPE